MSYKRLMGIGAGIILGLIIVIAGAGKLLYQAEFLAIILPNSFLSATQAKIVADWLPWIELILGLLLIIGIAARLVAALSCLLVVTFIAHNSWLISHGLGYEPCGCLGIVERLTQGELSTIGSLYLDIVMLVLALIVLFYYQRRFINTSPWFLRKGKNG